MTNNETPPNPYDAEDALHVDEFPPFNGHHKAAFAFDDDGTRYKVLISEFNAATYFQPERKWRETILPEREGVGEHCRGCGQGIEWDAIIVNSEWHLRCYVGENGD